MIACVQIGTTIVQGQFLRRNWRYATVLVDGREYTGRLIERVRK